MLKQILVLAGLSLSLTANAVIIDLGNITRDTDTGLDWLDVTETRGLSYNQVTAQFGAGGDYEGFRYATAAELDQLLLNFGYVPITTTCPQGESVCDRDIPGDSPLIENIITTLGDTFDDFADAVNDPRDLGPGGTGFTFGILGSQDFFGFPIPGVFDTGIILDSEFVRRDTGLFDVDQPDTISSLFGVAGADGVNLEIGSFLVAPSPVPVPAAGWLFLTALAGLVGKKLSARR